jgi:hypothetical protein
MASVLYSSGLTENRLSSNPLTSIRPTGAEGFEPPNGWTKTSCLTTWRRPIDLTFVILAVHPRSLSTVLEKIFSFSFVFGDRRSCDRLKLAGSIPIGRRFWVAAIQAHQLATAGCLTGISIINSQPLPGSDSQVRWPPCFSTTIL